MSNDLIHIRDYSLTLERLLKQGDERIDAINDWNALVLMIDHFHKILKELETIINEDLVTKDEFNSLVAIVSNNTNMINDLMDKYNELRNDVDSNDIDIANIQNEIEILQTQLEGIYDLITNLEANKYYYVATGSGTYDPSISNEVTISVNYDELIGFSINDKDHDILLLSHNGVVQSEGEDYYVISKTINAHILELTLGILDEDAIGEFYVKTIYNGIALDNNFLPAITKRTLFNVDGENEIDYLPDFRTIDLIISVNGIVQEKNIDYTIEVVNNKIVFTENHFGQVYVIETLFYASSEEIGQIIFVDNISDLPTPKPDDFQDFVFVRETKTFWEWNEIDMEWVDTGQSLASQNAQQIPMSTTDTSTVYDRIIALEGKTESVTSVNGQLGDVNLTGSDIDVSDLDNTKIDVKLADIQNQIDNIDVVAPGVESVNGLTGEVVLNSSNIAINDVDTTTIEDNLTKLKVEKMDYNQMKVKNARDVIPGKSGEAHLLTLDEDGFYKHLPLVRQEGVSVESIIARQQTPQIFTNQTNINYDLITLNDKIITGNAFDLINNEIIINSINPTDPSVIGFARFELYHEFKKASYPIEVQITPALNGIVKTADVSTVILTQDDTTIMNVNFPTDTYTPIIGDKISYYISLDKPVGIDEQLIISSNSFARLEEVLSESSSIKIPSKYIQKSRLSLKNNSVTLTLPESLTNIYWNDVNLDDSVPGLFELLPAPDNHKIRILRDCVIDMEFNSQLNIDVGGEAMIEFKLFINDVFQQNAYRCHPITVRNVPIIHGYDSTAPFKKNDIIHLQWRRLDNTPIVTAETNENHIAGRLVLTET